MTIEQICRKWIEEEYVMRKEVETAREQGKPFAAHLFQSCADRTAIMRRELQEAAGFVVKAEDLK